MSNAMSILHVLFSEQIHLILLGLYPAEELLGYTAYVCLTLVVQLNIFPEQLFHFTFLPAMYKEFQLLHILTNTWLSWLKTY